jgi:hypothetical protein
MLSRTMLSRTMLSLIIAVGLVVILGRFTSAESLETQSNPVANGAINVATDDADRSDWEGIPWYEFDDDFEEFYPVDIDRVQIAHDATNVYFHIQALEWDVEESWRIGTYLDTDRDPTTGYTGNFLPVGADHFLEDALASEFSAATQAEWVWTETGEVARDQSSMLDVELAVPRSAIGNTTEFDFILFANNFCCDFQTPDDIYPNEFGGVFTYELGEVIAEPGDFNADGQLDALDIDALSTDVAQMLNTPAFDLTGDSTTTLLDIEAWLELNGTVNGDADLSGDVVFSDFLILSSGFGQSSAWSGGDFDGDGSVQFSDFLILSGNFGQEDGSWSAGDFDSDGLVGDRKSVV